MSNYSINNKHLLEGEGVSHMRASKNDEPFADGALDTLVIHYTAGRDAVSSAKYLARADVKASAHLVISREGEVIQLVPFDKKSWHAGRSSYMGRSGFNNYSIGIELDNAGILTRVGNQYQAWFGKKYPEEEVVRAVHRNETKPAWWHAYTEAQLQTCEDIARLLIDTYHLKLILGHEEIAPGRKQDPGPAFPLDKLRNRLLHSNRKDDNEPADPDGTSAEVVASSLNIRSGPGAGFDKVARPLTRGTEVKILEEQNGWYRVSTRIEGWVSRGYVKLKEGG